MLTIPYRPDHYPLGSGYRPSPCGSIIPCDQAMNSRMKSATDRAMRSVSALTIFFDSPLSFTR